MGMIFTSFSGRWPAAGLTSGVVADLKLRRLDAHQPVKQQLGGVGVRRVVQNGRGSHDEHRSVARVDDLERIAPVAAHQRGSAGPRADLAFLRVQHGHGVVDRAPDLRVVGLEPLEVLPAVILAHRQHPEADVARKARVADADLVLPARIEQVGPFLGRVGLLHQLGVVGDLHQPGGGDEIGVILVDVAELRQDEVRVLRTPAQQPSLRLQGEVVAHVG